jgi:hypothetical protein
MKNVVFCEMKLYDSFKSRRFGGTSVSTMKRIKEHVRSN